MKISLEFDEEAGQRLIVAKAKMHVETYEEVIANCVRLEEWIIERHNRGERLYKKDGLSIEILP